MTILYLSALSFVCIRVQSHK